MSNELPLALPLKHEKEFLTRFAQLESEEDRLSVVEEVVRLRGSERKSEVSGLPSPMFEKLDGLSEEDLNELLENLKRRAKISDVAGIYLDGLVETQLINSRKVREKLS